MSLLLHFADNYNIHCFLLQLFLKISNFLSCLRFYIFHISILYLYFSASICNPNYSKSFCLLLLESLLSKDPNVGEIPLRTFFFSKGNFPQSFPVCRMRLSRTSNNVVAFSPFTFLVVEQQPFYSLCSRLLLSSHLLYNYLPIASSCRCRCFRHQANCCWSYSS